MPSVENEFDALIIGAGLAGLYAVHRLRGLGLRVRAFEAGNGVGGTWFWNRYPGARCDVVSLEYSYSFSEELQQEWRWPERYGAQRDILRYINHVADRFDLRRDIQLDTRIVSAAFDDTKRCWRLTTEAGQVFSARFCIAASGNLSIPRVPDFEGLGDFKGNWYHTGLWPLDGVDFTGRRVAVIGTGSSGIQLIPQVAKQAAHLHVFQRTANFSQPAQNTSLDPETERQHKACYAERRRAAYDTPFGISGHPPPTKSALAASHEERLAAYEAAWAAGQNNVGILYAYTDLLTNRQANDTAAEFVRSKIRSIVRNPVVAELLSPKDHPIGTKRLCLDTGYYETYNRDNVTLVDARSDPIRRISSDGLELASGRGYAFDAIVFATGFDAMTGALTEIDVRGRDGVALAERWSAGPLTYLGLMVAGFPNLFLVTGPGSPSVKSQMILAIEQHINWIAEGISYLRDRGKECMEATEGAEAQWVAHVNEVAATTLYPLANSWYVGANIPGKPRVFMPYVGGVASYTRKCAEVAQKGYEGFALT